MRAIIVTGLSGAGKTLAIDCLEDMGYYCVDNMPPALIKSFIDLASNGKGIEKAAFVIDVRGGVLFDDLKGALEDLKKAGVDYKILYFEASEKVLARRYNETRRAHPLAEGGSVLSGIRKEKDVAKFTRRVGFRHRYFGHEGCPVVRIYFGTGSDGKGQERIHHQHHVLWI